MRYQGDQPDRGPHLGFGEMALKVGATFRSSPDFWLNAQKAVDLFHAESGDADLPSPVLKGS